MIYKNFKPSQAIQKSKSSSGNGMLTIVNSVRNGRRLEFRKEVAKQLKLVDELTVMYTDVSAIFFRGNGEREGSFRIKKSGERLVVYSGALVDELSSFFDLDFSSGVCHTFTDGEIEEIDGLAETALIITKKKIKNVEV